jgi:ribosomal protein L40E
MDCVKHLPTELLRIICEYHHCIKCYNNNIYHCYNCRECNVDIKSHLFSERMR